MKEIDNDTSLVHYHNIEFDFFMLDNILDKKDNLKQSFLWPNVPEDELEDKKGISFIASDDYFGILLQSEDLDKRVSEVDFNLQSMTDVNKIENKIFSLINLLEQKYGYFETKHAIYYLLGKLREANFLEKDMTSILTLLNEELAQRVSESFAKIIRIKKPTVIDVVLFINENKHEIFVIEDDFIKPLDNYDVKTTRTK